MGSERVQALVGGAFVGLLIAASLRWFFGDVAVWLGPPFDSWLVWLAAGAVVAAGLALYSVFEEERRTRDFQRAAPPGLTYAARVERDALGVHAEQPLFAGWAGGANHLTGSFDGEPVVVVDYTTETSDGEGRCTRHTATAILLDGTDLPAFHLAPAGGLTLFFDWVGLGGVTFAVPDGTPPVDVAGIESFNERYRVHGGPAAAAVVLATGEATRPEQEVAIRRRFTAEVLRYLAGHPGWSIASDGRSLAFCRDGRTIAPARLGEVLREVVEIVRTLRAAPPAEPGRELPPASGRRSAPLARIVGGFVGVFAGFLLAGVGGMVLLSQLGVGRLPELVLVTFFFGLPILGAILGGFLGVQVGPWFVPRPAPAKARPLGQPTGSDAVARKHVGSLVVELPPRGLLRGNGFFLAFVVVWTVLVGFFVAIFVPELVAGQVRVQGVPEWVAPWAGPLFLLPFVAVGIGSIVGAVYNARRSATVAVHGGSLTLRETTLFGTTETRWPAGGVRAVHAGGLVPGMVIAADPPVRVLTYRSRDEVTWLAGLVRKELGLDASMD